MDYFIEKRVVIGFSIFLICGILDLAKNKENPKRAKEYGFLLSLAVLSTIFAIIHDFITFNISYEYFQIAKDLGPGIKFYPEVIYLAIKASYWFGIIIGVMFLLANNPIKHKIQLKYKELYKKLIYPFICAILFALFVGSMSPIFPDYFSRGGEEFINDLTNYNRVAYIHWGTYIGGFLGSLFGVWKILKLRKMIETAV